MKLKTQTYILCLEKNIFLWTPLFWWPYESHMMFMKSNGQALNQTQTRVMDSPFIKPRPE